VGLSEELIGRYADRLVGIPTMGAVRSLNLANAVGIALFEAHRRVGALDATFLG
jgi:tRNA (cytidine/uridine-2'-O-)-methyltransferase